MSSGPRQVVRFAASVFVAEPSRLPALLRFLIGPLVTEWSAFRASPRKSDSR